jgi:hypothetical protein
MEARRGSVALKAGSFSWLDSPADVLAYRRHATGDTRLVFINYSDSPASVALPAGGWVAEVSSVEGAVNAKREDRVVLRGLEALLLRPV